MAVAPESTTRTTLTRAEQIDRLKAQLSRFEVSDADAGPCCSISFSTRRLRLWQFANHVDSLAIGGRLMADIWMDKRIITIDLLGQDFCAEASTS